MLSCWHCLALSLALKYTDIEGFQPEWSILTIYHCRGFWSETVDMFYFMIIEAFSPSAMVVVHGSIIGFEIY